MSLNRHSTPPGGVRNPIDSQPPRAYAPPIAPHWAIGTAKPGSQSVKGAHPKRLFLCAEHPFMVGRAGTSQEVAGSLTRFLADSHGSPPLDCQAGRGDCLEQLFRGPHYA